MTIFANILNLKEPAHILKWKYRTKTVLVPRIVVFNLMVFP